MGPRADDEGGDDRNGDDSMLTRHGTLFEPGSDDLADESAGALFSTDPVPSSPAQTPLFTVDDADDGTGDDQVALGS